MKTDTSIPTWIAYKVKADYPITGTVYWTQKLDGPYKNTEKLVEDLKALKLVQRQSKDVKDIRTLIEN